MTKSESIAKVYCFTACAPWDDKKLIRHQRYMSVLEAVGVTIVLGSFRRKDCVCRLCHRDYSTYEEKETDINIAINLFRDAMNDVYDTAVVISGDSDLRPAMEAVKTSFPEKSVRVIVPIGRKAKLLQQTADSHMKMKEHHLASSQFPDTVLLPDGRRVQRPDRWR